MPFKTLTHSIILAALLHLSPAYANTPDISPEPVSGETIIFDVYRGEDTHFGTHRIAFSRDGQDLISQIDIDLRAGIGPITVFRYQHQSTERWSDGRLIELSNRTLKDGEAYTLEAHLTPEGLSVTGKTPEGEPVSEVYRAPFLPSSHWHGYPVDLQSMINTEHGTPMETEITYLGQAQIEADGQMIQAHHFRLQSTLTLDLWYDMNGRWAGCAFEARNQSIRYVRRANPLG
ncbi:DUF6134 family protein [Woodsholea maritima]|uniref:DUF6134 family protein n=1 Tax=Woodsholea maritima TaxID=240237 RepID=UPI000380C9B8|nr:DUF6134 family protein [Woodsholea maritima]